MKTEFQICCTGLVREGTELDISIIVSNNKLIESENTGLLKRVLSPIVTILTLANTQKMLHVVSNCLISLKQGVRICLQKK